VMVLVGLLLTPLLLRARRQARATRH